MFQTEAGQGIIEYLLVLLLTVSLIIALSRGVAEPIVNHLQSKVFDLVGCMLRVGELPHIAYDICGGDEALNLDFQGALASTSGGGGGGATNSSDSTDSDNANNGGDSENSDSGDNGPNVRERSGNGSLDGNGRGGGPNRRGGSNDFAFDDESGDQKIKLNNEEGGGDSSFESKIPTADGTTVIVTKIRRKNEQVGGGFSLISDEEAKENEIQNTATPTTTVKSSNEKEPFRKVSSFSVEENSKTRGPILDDNGGDEFSIMKFIKWGLIIAIIVIFLLFSLTQLNSIRKGWTE